MSTYLDRNFRAGMRSPYQLDGLGFSLFGKPQAWYSRIDADQNALTVRLAEITAADQGLWDQIWTALQMGAGGKLPTGAPFVGWAWGKQAILDAWGTLTPTRNPSDAQFAYAEQLLADTAQMVAYFKKIYPEGAKEIQKEAAFWKEKVEAVTPLRSPEEAGMETFKKTLEERANSMVSQFSIGAGVIAAGAAIILGLVILARR